MARIIRNEAFANIQLAANKVETPDPAVYDLAARNARVAAVLAKRDAERRRAAAVNRICRIAACALTVFVVVALFYAGTN